MKSKMIKIWIDRDECYDLCFGLTETVTENAFVRWQTLIPEKKYKQLQKLTTRYYKEVQGYLEKIVKREERRCKKVPLNYN
jgi:hypothetical protein